MVILLANFASHHNNSLPYAFGAELHRIGWVGASGPHAMSREERMSFCTWGMILMIRNTNPQGLDEKYRGNE